MTDTPFGIPAAIASAIQRLTAACRAACEQSAQSLGLGALSVTNGLNRERLLDAQNLLTRAQSTFARDFADALQTRIEQEWSPRGAAALELPTNWDALSLVDDHELDIQVAAERFGMAIGHACEWELRELSGYLRALSQNNGRESSVQRHNILRPETIGKAVMCAMEALPTSGETRKLLESELARSWATALPKIYAAIISELRAAGVTPLAMAIRTPQREARGQATAGQFRSGPNSGRGPASGSGPANETRASSRGAREGFSDAWSARAEVEAAQRLRQGLTSLGRANAPSAEVDSGMMTLLRRLTGASDALISSSPQSASGDSATAGVCRTAPDAEAGSLPNLIHAHREELIHTARGSMDHMVIDIIASLFDQILSDPKVPPQIARQIGRLQLPVLRTAIGDPSFFASRRHPVRRLINRIASLSAAFDDLDSGPGQALVSRVRDLVQSIVDGDFDQLQVYEQQLKELERFVIEQGRHEVESHGPTRQLLADRETELHAHRRSARQLKSDLQPLQAPEFVREFIAEVWTQVLLRTTQTAGPDSDSAKRARQAGKDLFMSVQPKGTPAQRQEFLSQLPKLMQELNNGMDLIAWPEESRKTFFGQLLPAHAQSLKGEGLRTLDYNLLARQVDLVLDSALQRQDTAAPRPVTSPVPLDTDHAPLLTPSEAQAVGLLAEDQVDWTGPLDIDQTEEPAVGPGDLAIQGLPEPEAPEPTKGRSLAEHVQIGFAYQMHLEDRWQKVRLTHVSPSRTFYVFSRGKRHQQVVSLTHRMLLRMCDTGRLRAFESAYLLERATARARRQLASLKPAPVTATP